MNQHDTFYASRGWFDRRKSSFGSIGSSDDGSSSVFELLFVGVSTFLLHNAETCSEHAFWKVGSAVPALLFEEHAFSMLFLVLVIVISYSLTSLPLPNLRLGSINSQADDSMTMCMSNSQLYPSQTKIFGWMNKRWNPDVRSTLQGRECSIWATNRWKVSRNSGFHLLFILPKSSFGEHKLRVTRWWSHDDLSVQLTSWSHDDAPVQLTTSSHKMMIAWRSVCPIHKMMNHWWSNDDVSVEIPSHQPC